MRTPPPPLKDAPTLLTVPAAGRYLGVGRDLARAMAREDRFPVPVLILGHAGSGHNTRRVVTRQSLIDLLGVDA